MSDIQIIDLTPQNIADYGVCGYKDVSKHKELRSKIAWYEKYFDRGLTIKAAVSDKYGYQGMIEYIPGEYAHRPVNAQGFMFIHCIFVGFKKECKGKGYGTEMIKTCEQDAGKAGMSGVAVVVRKGSFMADKDIFIKNGFEVTDESDPDFRLLVKKFRKGAEDPKFKANVGKVPKKFEKGVFILRSVQCPYTEKNVNAMIKTAKKKFKLKAELVNLEGHEETQISPCAFGTFCVIHDGEIISHHPISNTRFENIMKKRLG